MVRRTSIGAGRSGLTLREVIIIVILVPVFLWLLLGLPLPGISGELARRAACMSNLNGMGKAVTIYQSDNDDAWPWIEGTGGWEHVTTGTNQTAEPAADVNRSASAIPFLLVRDGQPSRMFICPSDRDAEADDNTQAPSGEYHWDFSHHTNLSYSWQAPLRRDGRYVTGVDGSLSSLVVVADKNPTYDGGDPSKVDWAASHWTAYTGSDEQEEARNRDRENGMSRNHTGRDVRGGEQIHFLRASITVDKSERADVNLTDVGVDGDNIYTTGGASPRGVMGIENHTDPNDSYLIGPVR